jgi:cob(I)yrinic acid a,c-diamide adenosyltransferase (EC 2.5.1.17)
MILVYTGNGKGKTSACVGQALRARGQGKRVVFGQFFKHPGQAGEQRELSSLLGDDFRAQGPGFCLGERDDINKHKEAAREMLAWAEEKLPGSFMLVLDEAIYALSAGILDEVELKAIIALCREKDVHLVLSGRGAPVWLLEEAEMVSEINEIKHHMQSGQKARAGIEF